MSEVISTKELADLIAKRSGMTRKVASATVKAIQEIIEEGVMRDGEVRVKGWVPFA